MSGSWGGHGGKQTLCKDSPKLVEFAALLELPGDSQRFLKIFNSLSVGFRVLLPIHVLQANSHTSITTSAMTKAGSPSSVFTNSELLYSCFMRDGFRDGNIHLPFSLPAMWKMVGSNYLDTFFLTSLLELSSAFSHPESCIAQKAVCVPHILFYSGSLGCFKYPPVFLLPPSLCDSFLC